MVGAVFGVAVSTLEVLDQGVEEGRVGYYTCAESFDGCPLFENVRSHHIDVAHVDDDVPMNVIVVRRS